MPAPGFVTKNLLYGIFFGAAGAYLYLTQGALVDSSLEAALQWRDGARHSVQGYSSN